MTVSSKSHQGKEQEDGRSRREIEWELSEVNTSAVSRGQASLRWRQLNSPINYYFCKKDVLDYRTCHGSLCNTKHHLLINKKERVRHLPGYCP